MNIEIDDSQSVKEIRIVGAINTSGVDQLDAELLPPEDFANSVLMDLSAVEYVDSRGISWLLDLHKQFTKAGGRLVMHSLSPQAKKPLKILRMTEVFHLCDTRALAMAMLDSK